MSLSTENLRRALEGSSPARICPRRFAPLPAYPPLAWHHRVDPAILLLVMLLGGGALLVVFQ